MSHFPANPYGEIQRLKQQLEHLRIENAEFQAKWDHFQQLCQDHVAHGIGNLIVQRDELLSALKYLQEHRLWINSHAKAVIESAIAKVAK